MSVSPSGDSALATKRSDCSADISGISPPALQNPIATRGRDLAFRQQHAPTVVVDGTANKAKAMMVDRQKQSGPSPGVG